MTGTVEHLNTEIEPFSTSGTYNTGRSSEIGAVKGNSIVQSEFWPFPRRLGPKKYLLHCEVFMVPLPSEMNFARGGSRVITMQTVFVYVCV